MLSGCWLLAWLLRHEHILQIDTKRKLIHWNFENETRPLIKYITTRHPMQNVSSTKTHFVAFEFSKHFTRFL